MVEHSEGAGSWNTSRRVYCPRCLEQCGWCSDPRWMHGTLNLPGTRRKCKVPGYEPEGDNCPLCHGSKIVWQHITYEPATKALSTPPPQRGEARNDG